MFSFPEQFSAASKANFDAQIALLTSLTGKTFEGMEKAVGLTLSAAKSSLQDSTETARALLATKNPQEFLSLTTAKAQPAAEKAIAFGRELAGIATDTQAEITKAAEAQTAETSRKMMALVEEVSKNAPIGSEGAVAFFKSAIGSANAGFEQLTKAAKQTVDTLEGNMNNAVSQFSQSVEKTTATTRAKK